MMVKKKIKIFGIEGVNMGRISKAIEKKKKELMVTNHRLNEDTE